MGFGEGRTLYLVDLLENSPEQSLFVIEEPETSLHEHAQKELAKYLLDVCYRRHHQIILSTHSHIILSSLPRDSLLFLHRDDKGVSVYEGLSSTKARAILSDGAEKDLIILVEDTFSNLLLTEMIRKIDPELLNSVTIESVGNTDAVRSAVELMKRLKKNCIGVRDGDIGENKHENLFSLPGEKAPEIEVFKNESVISHINKTFKIDTKKIIEFNDIKDHHKIPEVLAKKAHTPQEHLIIEAIKKYLEAIGKEQYEHLITEISKRA